MFLGSENAEPVFGCFRQQHAGWALCTTSFALPLKGLKFQICHMCEHCCRCAHVDHNSVRNPGCDIWFRNLQSDPME